jgi:hypothetical protein
MLEDILLPRLEKEAPDVAAAVMLTDAGARLTAVLRDKYSLPIELGEKDIVWDFAGLALQKQNRFFDALLVHWEHYQAAFRTQIEAERRRHKGTPLVRLCDCFDAIGFPIHAKRYLMLTLCEDAIFSKGAVSTDTGIYPRLVWRGIAQGTLNRYAQVLFELSETHPNEAFFPEALLQRLDDDWLTEFPSQNEVSFFRINPIYVRYLLNRLGDETGETLEVLAQYLMSCMPGCRARRRLRSKSTDYDVVCSMEGIDLDFRSELGRYFVCECKDWGKPADYSVMAKFANVLEDTKSQFGILFSKDGITGTGRMTDAEREQVKVFSRSGKVIIVLGLADLQGVADGANLIGLLRHQYETVRLDLRTTQPKAEKKKQREASQKK